MDNFMDKIAQKLNSQEVIRANAAADAAQLEKLKERVAEYDICMKEMRKLNLKNVENEQKLQILVEKSSEQIMKMFEESSLQMEKVSQECITKIKEVEIEKNKTPEAKEEVAKEAIEEVKNSVSDGFVKMEEAFKQADDYVHKENVKVYRNVQAVLVEELEKQSQALMSFIETVSAKNKSARIMGIITLSISVVTLILLIVHMTGIL